MASGENLRQKLENDVNELAKSRRGNRLTALDLAIGRGTADADAGRLKPIGDVAARLEDKYGSRS
ncbi:MULTISPECIES: type II toxin-antitoxin system ParD family antitoxin [Rhizobium]|uniref:type II toxin-antitoxin system ParD family antitoxin n=1 Tax=Rhizobium TaxID=379 RepID=UPI00235E96AA|nr:MULTISPECIES: type II toxin-antitoxin system ParD family antitoxin [unclassified Rhizobium]MDC9810375.1 type II toxin-antitoxin system ParD family antitoxin [Rhizobium sp. MC62]WEA24478.1 type II toxin-antitoxin system ParD family antitoxin [Rhizobium sp. MJ22]WEA58994.1 type II toxin-antitoxin system ParD family antitoxin [Rhizobium sp. BJ04]